MILWSSQYTCKSRGDAKKGSEVKLKNVTRAKPKARRKRDDVNYTDWDIQK